MLALVVTEPTSQPIHPQEVAPSRAPDGVPPDVAAAAAGDRRAFERVYRTHVDRVYTLCARMLGDAGSAEEVTQDVFVRVWEKLPQFRAESQFGTWLHRVAVNVVLTHRKTLAIGNARTVSDESALDVAPTRPVTVGERVDLEDAIARLPIGARRVFLLHDVEGYTHEEIGKQMGITPGGSKAQLHRARMLLRAALSR